MKSFKEMLEDAPVNATGDAVATNEPIVRKKKKKQDSEYREIGTPELLKRYVDDTPGQSLSENAKVKKVLSKVKGLSKQQIQILTQLPTPVLTSMINQLSVLVAGDDDEHPPHVKDKEKEKKKVVLKGSFKSVQESKLLTQGKLVTSIDQVFDIITKKLKSEMGKKYKRNRDDGLQFINRLAKMVGMTASDKGQMKNKMFLRMGEELEEGLWDNIRKKRARGEKMRKKGEKGAPTDDQIKRAQEECCAECLGYYDHQLTEAEYQGKKVTLNDPIRTSENPNKKFKVYVKGESGKVVVVRFGDPKIGYKS